MLAALNIADEFHMLKRKYDSIATDYNERAEQLAGALDEVLAETATSRIKDPRCIGAPFATPTPCSGVSFVRNSRIHNAAHVNFQLFAALALVIRSTFP